MQRSWWASGTWGMRIRDTFHCSEVLTVTTEGLAGPSTTSSQEVIEDWRAEVGRIAGVEDVSFGFVFGEQFTQTHFVTFGAIWLALALYSYDGIMHRKRLRAAA